MKIELRKKLLASALVPLFTLPLALTSHAQSSGTSSAEVARTAEQAKTQKSSLDMRASKLMGKEVKNAKGENLGEIKDLMVDLKGERVPYAVLSFGGIAGLGDKLFAYPVSSFKPSANSDELVLNVDQARLKSAPGFDKDHWPDWADSKYRGEVDRYYKSTPPKMASGATLMRASKLVGKDVNDREGTDAGEIEDLVVNLGSGRVRYAVLDFDKKWNPDDKLVALPLKALTIPADPDKDLVLNASRDSIKTAQSFDENQWPDLNKPDYRRSIDNALARFRTDRGTATERSAGSSATTGSTQSGK
jgi:sporulation protein YlmC with PRC-barrel domain